MDEINAILRRIKNYEEEISNNIRQMKNHDEAYEYINNLKSKIIGDRDKIVEIENAKRQQVKNMSTITNSRFAHRYVMAANEIASGGARKNAYNMIQESYDNFTKAQNRLVNEIHELENNNSRISNEITRLYQEIRRIQSSQSM